jgi:hypothetical protein
VKWIRNIFLLCSAFGAVQTVLHWQREGERNFWLGVFLADALWALIVHLFYIQPKGKT